ncbi:MAG: PGPGW domain-containing protein [Acidimicrobiia bacterium]
MARKALVGIAGVVVIAIGIVFVPLPGPGWLIIFGGLAILSTEFPAARRKLERLRARARSFIGRGD